MSSLLMSYLAVAASLVLIANGQLTGEPDFDALREVLTSGSADLLPQADLQRFLENVGDGPAPLLFPVLSLEQQKVGVNPSYDGFFGPVVGDLTANADDDDDSSDNNDEVAEDPFTSNAKYLIPKKASLKALLDNDPRVLASSIEDGRINDIYFTTIVGVTSGLAVFLIVGAGFVYHRARKNAKAAEDVEYPAYGVTGPAGKETSPTSGDRKLAQNAQLYHYQHQKQQMIAFDSNTGADRRNGAVSDNESEDGEEGDYTVYECPGLAPTGEMEVRNPMFEDDATPKAAAAPK
jgi:hypothetical protein